MKYVVYSDIEQNLKSNYVYDLEAIRQSITNILTTPKNTRLFLAEFGCDLEGYLFELMDDLVAFQIYTEIIAAISRWEPRVILDTGQSSVTLDHDNHVYHLKLIFSVKGLSDDKFEYAVGLSK